jgi:hypothetical protein
MRFLNRKNSLKIHFLISKSLKTPFSARKLAKIFNFILKTPKNSRLTPKKGSNPNQPTKHTYKSFAFCEKLMKNKE